MIRSAVTISLVEEARGGPFVFWHDLPAACRTAKQLGFDAIEVFPPAPEAIDSGTLGQLLREHGLALAAVGTGAGWVKHRLTLTSGDPGIRARAREFIQSIIRAAGVFQAPAIIGSMQGRHGEGVDAATARAYLAESLEELGSYAQQFGVPLIYEPLNRYETNLITTMEAGVAFLSSLSTNNVRLLADLFHMNIEETNLADALSTAGAFLGHVHFVDSNRRPAGLGHTDFGPIAQTLRNRGYAGYLSAEAFPYPDSESAARRTIETFRTFFRTV